MCRVRVRTTRANEPRHSTFLYPAGSVHPQLDALYRTLICAGQRMGNVKTLERLSLTLRGRTSNGKLQKWNFCRLSLALWTVEWNYLYLWRIVGDIFLCLCDKKKRTQIQRSSLPFDVRPRNVKLNLSIYSMRRTSDVPWRFKVSQIPPVLIRCNWMKQLEWWYFLALEWHVAAPSHSHPPRQHFFSVVVLINLPAPLLLLERENLESR